MLVNQAYRYELQPTRGQLASFWKHVGMARFAYNWGLQERIRIFKENEGKDRFVSFIDQQNAWNAWKRTNAPWWVEVSKCAPQEALRNLDQAFKNFWKGRKVGRVGFPKFKKRGVYDSFKLAGTLKVLGRKVQLPRIGKIRTKESTEKFKGRILSATVSREADRWYVSFCVEVNRADPKPLTNGPVIGIDLGLNHFAVLSDGTQINAPKPLKASLHRLQRRSKQHSRKKKGSNNRRKSVICLARLHRRIKNQRKDFLHKLTSSLVSRAKTLVIEDLNVKGMSRSRRLSRSIVDAGWSEFRRLLNYKTAWYGSELIVADRFYPSSKLCSACGVKKDSLTLSDRVFRCESCGFELDRDLNAAKNLATESSSGSNACGDGSSGNQPSDCETTVCETGIGCGYLSAS